MSKKWFNNINSVIKDRGETYYYLDKVKNVKKEGNVYKAEVNGTNTYHTSVEIKWDTLVSSSSIKGAITALCANRGQYIEKQFINLKEN